MTGLWLLPELWSLPHSDKDQSNQSKLGDKVWSYDQTIDTSEVKEVTETFDPGSNGDELSVTLDELNQFVSNDFSSYLSALGHGVSQGNAWVDDSEPNTDENRTMNLSAMIVWELLRRGIASFISATSSEGLKTKKAQQTSRSTTRESL